MKIATSLHLLPTLPSPSLTSTAVLLSAILGLPSSASDAAASSELELIQRLEQLESTLERQSLRLDEQDRELAKAQAKERERWSAQHRQAELDRMIHEVMSDINERATLLDGSPLAGHDGSEVVPKSWTAGWPE